MPVYIYRIELDSSVSEIARKEMQDAVDSAGLNGHVNIYQKKRGNERNKKMELDEDCAWSSC